MPQIPRRFPATKVSNWSSGEFGGAAEAGLITATGGDSTGTYGAWKWHKFLSSADFTVTSGIGELELFMVGGGGGGGTYTGAGGGGGGIFEVKTVVHTAGGNGSGVYPITVGAGGPDNGYYGSRGGWTIWADGTEEEQFCTGGGSSGGYLWNSGGVGGGGG